MAEEAEQEIQQTSSLFATPPTVRANDIERVSLCAWIQVQSTVETKAVAEIVDGLRRWQVSSSQVGYEHLIPVLGLYANQKNLMRVRLTSVKDGFTETSQPIEFITAPLPESFPPLQVLHIDPENMEPGMTLFSVNLWQENVSMLDYGYLIALDELGGVVWYCRTQDRIADLRLLRSGRIIYQHGSYRYLYEIDFFGGDHRSWYAARTSQPPNDRAIAVDVDTIHHETIELPNGNFLTLSTEIREFPHYPSDVRDPMAERQKAWVVCDEVVEFQPDTGSIIQRLPLTDLLDHERFGFLSLNTFWRDKYDDFLDSPSRDWSHANALQFLPADNSVLVSFRHLSCIMKIDWETKQLRWILGDPAGWTETLRPYLLQPKGNLQWFYHQHAAHFTEAGTLMMFDNGNYRAVPFQQPTMAPDNYSRAVAYRVNESEMTVEQVYSYGAPQGDRFYSPFFGEAEILPVTGNLLITDGGRVETVDGIPQDEVPGGRQWARIVEITGDNYPAKVFELVCASPLGSRFGWSIYRAERIPRFDNPYWINKLDAKKSDVVFPRLPPEKKNPFLSYQPSVVGPPSPDYNTINKGGSR
jgi:arylsulfate sulfotransferase